MLNWYKTLIALRNAHPALARGTLTLEDQESPSVLALVREAEGERLLVLANYDDETQVDTSAYAGATELLTGAQVGETFYRHRLSVLT